MLECLFGIGLMLLGLLLGIGLIRLTAAAVLALIALAAAGFVVYSVQAGDWQGWFDIGWHAAVTGLVAAVASLPVLPYTPFFNRKK